MKNIKTYIMIALFSALIGVCARFVWYFLGRQQSITWCSIRYYMVVGLIFGTVTMIVLSITVLRLRKQFYVYIVNIAVETILLVALFFYQNLEYPQFGNIHKWVGIWLAIELLSTLLTTYWLRQIARYNKKLARKKEIIDK